jgi:hypothetical protein
MPALLDGASRQLCCCVTICGTLCCMTLKWCVYIYTYIYIYILIDNFSVIGEITVDASHNMVLTIFG